jgi:hypothetical protein
MAERDGHAVPDRAAAHAPVEPWPVAPWRSLDVRHVDAAREAQRALGPGLAALRAVPLPFPDGVVDPLHALRWLEAPPPAATPEHAG